MANCLRSRANDLTTLAMFSFHERGQCCCYSDLALGVIAAQFFRLLLSMDGQTLGGLYRAREDSGFGDSLSNTITFETNALIVRIYVRPQSAAISEKSSLR